MEMLCSWESARYFIFSSNVPTLLYYSHLTAVITAVTFGLILIPQVRKSLSARLFLTTILLFTGWTIIDLPLWALNRPDVDMFLWSIQVLLEMGVYVMAFYFAYSFIHRSDLQFRSKILLFSLLAPIILLLPTNYLFPAVDLSTCVIEESPFLIWYGYILEIFIIAITVVASILGIQAQPGRKREIRWFTTGLIVFLGAFSSGNIIGSFTENWNLAQVGLFGMPVFIAFLTYTVVRFKSFNTKLIGAQALIVSLVVLIGSEFFFIQNNINRVLTAVTLIITGFIGINLIRSVKKQIEQREHIEQLAGELEKTNKRQETLLHYIGHEVKGFLTKDMGALAALSEGDLGALPENIKQFVDQTLAQSRYGVRSVTDILTAANQKKGTISYAKESFDLKEVVAANVEKVRRMADEKKLTLTLSVDESGAPYTMQGDKEKMGDNVLRNLIENSVYYTPSGSVDVSLKKANGKIIFAVKDTGVGISDEDKKNLFTEGGHGKESQKINAHSTGYGLFIAKNIVEAHGGTIRAESEGQGKGSAFTVELPVAA